MSLSTSYRYEAMAEKKSLKNALHRQHERIQTDEMMAAREQQARMESCINLKSNWTESLEHMAAVQRAKSDARHMKSELAMAHKANLMVRKAALRQLLDMEHKVFENELHTAGKAFYIKRT